jgi:hypothetical protein
LASRFGERGFSRLCNPKPSGGAHQTIFALPRATFRSEHTQTQNRVEAVQSNINQWGQRIQSLPCETRKAVSKSTTEKLIYRPRIDDEINTPLLTISSITIIANPELVPSTQSTKQKGSNQPLFQRQITYQQMGVGISLPRSPLGSFRAILGTLKRQLIWSRAVTLQSTSVRFAQKACSNATCALLQYLLFTPVRLRLRA